MRKQVFEENPQYISQKTTKKWHQSRGVAHKFCPNWSKIQVFDKKIAKILRFCLRNAVLFFAFCEKLKIFQKSGKWRNFSEIALESVLSKKTRFWSKSPVQIAKNYKKMTSITGGSTQILSEIHVLTKKSQKFSVVALEMPFYFCFLWKTKNLSKKWKMEELFRNCLRISTLWENTFLKQIRSTYRKKLQKNDINHRGSSQILSELGRNPGFWQKKSPKFSVFALFLFLLFVKN